MNKNKKNQHKPNKNEPKTAIDVHFPEFGFL